MTKILENTPYFITSRSIGKTLDVELTHGNVSGNNPVILHETHNGENQQWYFEKINDGLYYIRTAITELYLEYNPENKKLIINPKNENNDLQKFKLTAKNDETYRFTVTSQQSELSLTALLDNPPAIHYQLLDNDTESSAQEFIIEHVDEKFKGALTFSEFLEGEDMSKYVRDKGLYELTVVFSSSEAGQISHLGSFMPEKGLYRVSIGIVGKPGLINVKINQEGDAKVSYQELEKPIDIEAKTEYYISIHNTDFNDGEKEKPYYRYDKKGQVDYYPSTIDTLTILRCEERKGAYSEVVLDKKPGASYTWHQFGLPEFVFKKN